MTNLWDELFELARDIDHQANAANATIDTEKARQLARIVLALGPDARIEIDSHPFQRRFES
jgi:hypothetical protein